MLVIKLLNLSSKFLFLLIFLFFFHSNTSGIESADIWKKDSNKGIQNTEKKNLPEKPKIDYSKENKNLDEIKINDSFSNTEDPVKLSGLYDPEKLPVGPSFLKKPEGVSEFNRVRSEYFMQYLEGGDISSDPYMQKYLAVCDEDFSTEKGWKEARANYFANITLVDNMVGDIISSLEKNNISENTIVVFTSEHGEMMGDHGLLEKRALYEEASRVPLLFKVPWLNNQQKMIDGSISHIDLVPTLMDLIGEDLPDHLQGKSRKGVFEGTENLDDNNVVVQWNGTGNIPDRALGSDSINSLNASPWRSIISERLKLNLCATDKPELFDLNLDKFEQENVFSKDEYRDSVSKLFESILQWQKDAEDSADLPDLGNI